MVVNISENLDLQAAQADVWRLLRNTPRLAGFIPSVHGVATVESAATESYTAKVTEKVGPFKVNLSLEIQIVEAIEPSALKASLKGMDSGGMSRSTGVLNISLNQSNSGTLMHFEANVEVLGKLATLGSTVIRRRVTEQFAEFGRRIRAEFAPMQL